MGEKFILCLILVCFQGSIEKRLEVGGRGCRWENLGHRLSLEDAVLGRVCRSMGVLYWCLCCIASTCLPCQGAQLKFAVLRYNSISKMTSSSEPGPLCDRKTKHEGQGTTKALSGIKYTRGLNLKTEYIMTHRCNSKTIFSSDRVQQ